MDANEKQLRRSVAAFALSQMAEQCLRLMRREPENANVYFQAYVNITRFTIETHFPEVVETLSATDVAENLLKTDKWKVQ